jgi:hypothetical protein
MTKATPSGGKSTVGAGVAGASGGTGLLAFVSSVPDTNHWKPFLMFAAPTISVAISGLWILALRWLDNWIADRSLAAELRKAEIALEAIEAAQHSSERAIKEARAKVEALRLLRLTVHSNRVQAIVGN